MIAPVSEVSSCDYSNHLDINSAWKSLVAMCVFVCVAEARTRVFNTFVSSAKVFISSAKRVRLQRQKCSSPSQNVFVASDKHVRLQCDSYLEVSSKDCLVASDERVRLQCEIIFGGDIAETISSFVINAFVLV